MTAAVLGALHGVDWLGDLALTVQDADYLTKIAQHSHARMVDPGLWSDPSPHLREELKLTLLTAATDKTSAKPREFPDGRHFRIADLELLDDRIVRARLQLSDGQTVLTDTPTLRPRTPAPPQIRTSQQPDGHRNNSTLRTAENSDTTTGSWNEDATPGTAVILATRSLPRSAAFYAQLIGRDIPIRSGTASVSQGLLLEQRHTELPIDTTSVSVQITVGLLADAARRLGLDDGRNLSSGEVLEVKDPDGRTVRVSQRRTST